MIPRTVPACAALAALLVFPSIGLAAVERNGNTFLPRTGSELLEAATVINNEGASNSAVKHTIQLSGGEYAVGSTVVLTSLSAPTVIGPSSGQRAVITNTGTTPVNLLRISSQVTSATSGVSNVDFQVRGATANTVVAVDLRRGGQLRDSTVTIPGTASKATGVQLSPALGTATPVAPAVLQRVRVNSNATEAPGVKATNGSQVLDSTLRGGTPALDIAGDGAVADFGNVIVDSTSITSTGVVASVPVVRVRGGANHLRAVLWSTSIDGRVSDASPLVDVEGPSAASGAFEADLGQLSLRGVQASIGVRVRPGASTATPQAVRLRGLLSLGSQFAVDCAGNAASATPSTDVAVTGVYRVGEHTKRTGCELFESGRRPLGTLEWRDEASGDLRPVWNSPLVDAVSAAGVPAPAGLRDLMGGDRFVQVSGESPGDIGALEYQLTMPEDVAASATSLGNRGLVALVGEANDPDVLEEPRLRFVWTMPDGSTADGPMLTKRFTSTEPQEVRLSVFDVTGKAVHTTTTVVPAIRPNEPATDSNDVPDPGDVPGDGGDGGKGGGGSLLPVVPQVIPVIPVAAPPAAQPGRTGPDPSLKQDFPPILKTVTARSRRVLTSRRSQPAYAAARRGEAEFVIQTYRKSEMALEVSSVLEGEGMTVGLPMASVPLKQFVGRKTLRVGSKIGKRKLKPGLYQMTIAATHRPGAVPERISFFVRVLRAR